MKDILSYQINYLLKKNNIAVDFEELDFQIKTHPTYPSLHAITGVLDHFNIENLAVDIPKEPATLNQLPNTFLAQVKIDGNLLFAVVTKQKSNFNLFFDNKNKKTVNQNEFLEQFTGIVLAVEKNEREIIADNDLKQNRNIITIFSIAACALILISFLNNVTSITNVAYFGLSLIGLYISYIILKQESGESTALGNAFCSNPTEKKNCNAVLSSKGARINKHFKISDLSFIYFIGLTLSTYILTFSNTYIFTAQLVSIVALPVIIYSIYYQAVVIKKWCFLCLSIVAVLCGQGAIALFTYSPIYNSNALFVLGLCFSAAIAFWLSQSQIIKNNITLKNTKLQYFKFKRNFELFNSQLLKSPVIETDSTSAKEIVFGNLSNAVKLVVVTNPLCGHCKPVHLLVENLLKQHKNAIKITIRFNVKTKDLTNKGTQIALRLLELYDTKNSTECLKAMQDIYGDFSTDQWLKKWNNCTNADYYINYLHIQSEWCTNNAINFTPELLINGRSYPKLYDRSDLIYFIDDLETHINNQKSIEVDIVQNKGVTKSIQ